MNNIVLNFDKINNSVYQSESIISKNLLNYLDSEYNLRIKNIEDRAI